jgi:hypothetical protein
MKVKAKAKKPPVMLKDLKPRKDANGGLVVGNGFGDVLFRGK